MNSGILLSVAEDAGTHTKWRSAFRSLTEEVPPAGGRSCLNQRSKQRPWRRSGEKGAELVEFALILPLVLVLIAAIWDFGRAYRAYQAITNAAREGVRLAVLPVGINQEEAIQNRVKAYLTKSSLDTSFMTSGNIDSYIAVDTPQNDPGNTKKTTVSISVPNGPPVSVTVSKVSVNYPFSFILLGPVMRLWVPSSSAGGAITLRTTVTMQNQI
jgi:Flp pilus assembly protein TadG